MTPTTRPERLYFLDWLRAAVFGLLILYHVGMYYVSWDWHIKSPHAADTIEPLMMLSSPWRLALLFLISGAATAMMLTPRPGRPVRPFVRERSKRLLLPLLLGMFVVVPPQAYLEVVSKVAYSGSYLDFMRLYLQAYPGFCRGDDCLELPTWNHMWFVAYLWVYSVMMWAFLKAWPAALDTLAALADRRLKNAWGLWLVPVALLALWRMLLIGRFPTTHALVDDFYNHALYLTVFLAGAVLARWGGGWALFARWRWMMLGLSLLLWAAIASYFSRYSGVEPPEWLRQLQRVGYAALQWSAIVAALGFAVRHWNHDHRWRTTVAEAVFPVYLLHQTVIILLAWALRSWGLAPVVEAPLLVAGTAVACVVGYLVAARLGPLRPWLGLAPRALPPVAVTARAVA